MKHSKTNTKEQTPQSVGQQMTYKVVCNFNDKDFYTDDPDTARDTFNEYREAYGDGIRLYEAIKGGDDCNEIEWELIDYYDEEEQVGHTSGEWKVIENKKSILKPFEIQTDSKCVASIEWGIKEIYPETHEEVKANARLIAKSPAMYKALKDLVEVVTMTDEAFSPANVAAKMILREIENK